MVLGRSSDRTGARSRDLQYARPWHSDAGSDPEKVKDTLKSNAIVNLTTMRYGVESGCKVKVKSAMLCTPATKVVSSSTAPSLTFDGQSMTSSKLCYKVKCPKVTLPDPLVLDQFGQRTLSKLAPKILCTPPYGAT